MYKSLADIIAAEKEQNLPFWKIVMQDDCVELAISEEESFRRMMRMYEVMKKSDADYEDTLMSRSGLVGTDGKKVHDARLAGKLVSGDFIGRVIERAIKMGESNACMKRIVAAPTAGSCGVIPAVFITVQEEKGYTDEQISGSCESLIARRSFRTDFGVSSIDFFGRRICNLKRY